MSPAAMWKLIQTLCSPHYFSFWAVGVWLCDLCLTVLIVRRVPYTNIDWETYTAQVDLVLQGQYNYSEVQGPTGPIAYPAGFCWVYGALRWLQVDISGAQVLFAALYLATLAVVLWIYKLARCPGWLAALCVLSKRVHSVYVLRLFNDAAAQLPLYLALLLFLKQRRQAAALAYSIAVSIKMHPLLYCPTVGLCLVLEGGWRHALALIGLMAGAQLGLALPFLRADAAAYLKRSFGGPGDLQQVWSVNWAMLPEHLFASRAFAGGLLLLHLALLAWFAHCRWIPGGLLDAKLRRWRAAGVLESQAVVGAWFGCNFVGICCLRTMHFQYISWYFHTVPFLAWYALQPELHQGIRWALRCVAVAALTLAVEVPYLLTTRGEVRGPDGRTWTTDGVPTSRGGLLLLVAHAVLLLLLARRRGTEVRLAAAVEEDRSK